MKREKVPLTRDTVGTLLRRQTAERPEAAAFIFDGQIYSWAQIDCLTDYIAGEMLELGIRRGTHVGFWSLNHILLALYLLAAMKLGAPAAVINYSYRDFELKNVLCGADIEYLFLGESKKGSDFGLIAEYVRDKCPKLRLIRSMEPVSSQAQEAFRAGEELIRAKEEVECGDVLCITFTSGTTKSPKPVELTHSNVINNVLQIDERMQLTAQDILAAPLPLFHSSGMTGMLIHAVASGAATLIHRMFRAGILLEDMQRYHVTALMAVPSMLEMLADAPDFDKYDISDLRVIQTSGAAISPERLRQVTERLGVEHLITGYGQTECSPLICAMRYEDSLEDSLHCSGTALEYVEVRICDPGTDTVLPDGEVGEMQVRGFNTMKGYYGLPEEMAKKFSADGWLKTTDAGWLDPKGYFHFSRRLSETIIRHGENISPAEIEFVVEQFSSSFRGVKVVGVPAPLVQEEIACLIETDRPVDPEEVRLYVRSRLASYKVPKYVFFMEHFPMTETGKADLAALRRLAKELADKQNS